MHDFNKDPRFKDITPIPGKCLLASPTMHGDEKEFINAAIDSGWVTTAGENIDALESEVSTYLNIPFAVALSSGTAALHLAIKLAGEKLYGQPRPGHGCLEGKKVFCSDMTFDATVNPVSYENGECVFIDTEYDTWNMDPQSLSRAFDLYPEVRLIVLAHLYGTPGKVEEIRKIADEHGAVIVEDAAESLGAGYFINSSSPLFDSYSDHTGVGCDELADIHKNGSIEVEKKRSGEVENKGIWVQTGGLGDIGIISFNGNKIITASSGGMLLCRELEDANKARKWSTQSREDAPWYQHEEIGYNYRMSNLIAGCGRGNFRYLKEHIESKKRIYERYREGLADLPVSMNPIDHSKAEPNYWLSCMIIDENAMSPFVRGDKDQLWNTEPGKSSPGEILEALKFFNAEGRPIWKPMHLQPIYRGNAFVTRKGRGRGQSNAYIRSVENVDVGADIFRRGLCLPSDNKMTDGQQDSVIEIIHRCFR